MSRSSRRAGTPIAAQERAQAARDNVVRLWTACPMADKLTPYDMQNLGVFNFLLNAEYEGAPQTEMARIIFRIDPDRHPAWASSVVRTHLARAHWLREHDFPYLDW